MGHVRNHVSKLGPEGLGYYDEMVATLVNIIENLGMTPIGSSVKIDILLEEGLPEALQAHVERTIQHELIHAYDHCRAEVDWKDCVHIACSEVRAASLSGDCACGKERGARRGGSPRAGGATLTRWRAPSLSLARRLLFQRDSAKELCI